MANNNKNETNTIAPNDFLITFKAPYHFEGKEYKTLDLAGLENITAEQLFEASSVFARNDYINPRPEADPKYCCMLAAAACGLPHEFFNGLPAREAVKVRNAVQSFFLEED